MQQQHHPQDARTYNAGANRDIDVELFENMQGQYFDACNMRTISMDGKNNAAVKINGEVLLFPNVDNRCIGGTGLPLSSTYECIGVCEVNNNIVEFWADAAESTPSLIRINGKIVLMSDLFPIQVKYPLQIAKNEACIGGEVYVTDYHVSPMVFNVKDLLLNSGINVGSEIGVCSDKYFDAFYLQEHLLVLTRVLDHPVFVKLDSGISGYDNVLGAGGLPVGYYTYSFRYVTTDGERTAWSAPTPQIPVMKRFSSSCPNYPYVKTISKDPDLTVTSIYGAHIRFRINNEANYDFVEIRRDRWNAGDLIGVPAISEVIGKIYIVDGQFDVLDVLDIGADAEETLSGGDITSVMAAVSRAKAIRYFNQKLYLMNVEYASRNIEDEVGIIGEGTSDVVFPTIENIGKAGHHDPYLATYYKSQMRGEKRGFGIIAWDEQGQWSYARKIVGADNYQFPNRRENTTLLTENTSYFGTVLAANVNGNVTKTYEVFDLENATNKTNKCLYANIMKDKGRRFRTFVNMPGCTDAQDEGLTNALGYVTVNKLGYRPFTPVGQDDLDCSYLDYRVNLSVANGGLFKDYNPVGFEPTYFSMGLALQGISDLPSWAKAFSVVNTPTAGRVVAQGLGYYRLRSADGAFGANVTKDTNKFSAYFPDLDENTGINPDIIDSVMSDPSAYAIQLVSPLGFFSEIFSFNNRLNGDSGVDFITYCRILKDNGQINPDENPSMGISGIGGRYVAYGKWRASTQFSLQFPGGTNGNMLFDIVGVVDHTESGTRSKYFDITVTPSPYRKSSSHGRINGDDPDVQNWHEPIYVINLVKKVAGIADTNIVNYQFTGHYQKVDSLVGISDGTTSQNYLLVDERWEDCMQTTLGQVQNGYSYLERFAWIEDLSGNRKRWINVTDKTSIQINAILSDLQTFGVATVIEPITLEPFLVYGVYKSSQIVNGTSPEYYLNFNWFDTSFSRDFFLPQLGYKIHVIYDNRVPIRVFGGDTWINESIWAVKDKLYNKNADPSNGGVDDGDGAGDSFRLNVAFPYRRFELNPRIFIINSTTGFLANNIQSHNGFKFDGALGGSPSKIRQLIAMFTAETRIDLALAFNDEGLKESNDQFFALKNYVMRPYNFSDNKFSTNDPDQIYDDNNIQAAYKDSYGDEWKLWGLGGFRFLPQTNIDYSKPDDTKEFTTLPKVGFHEQNLFCTRIIWSETRPVNIQDTPSVRTFTAQNFFDISDDTGEIKFAWDCLTGDQGSNLFAFTDIGICMLLVDKRIVSQITGDELAAVGSDIGGIQEQYWLTKSIGMSDEMWRSAAEYSNQLFFCNYDTSYKFDAGQLSDIGRKNYHSKIYREYLSVLGRGYSDRVTGVYNMLHHEYWVNFKKIKTDDSNAQEGISHELNSRLSVVNPEYDVSNVPTDEYVGSNGAKPIVITSGSGVVFLGGGNNNLLTYSVSICSDQSMVASFDVRFKSSPTSYTTLVTINPGECYCFTFVPAQDVYPSWTAEKCNPFGQDESPFEDFKCPTLVYGNEWVNREYGVWQGGFDYNFNRYLSLENNVYGMRGLETYRLNQGRIINGSLIEANIIGVCAAAPFKDKEFVRIRVNSDNKPNRIEFFDNFEQVLSDDVQAVLDADTNVNALRDYNGFEQYVPRKVLAPNDRMQGRAMLFKIVHKKDETFKVVTTELQYKPLK